MALDVNAPLDVIVLHLGCNELKNYFHLTADMIAYGMEKLGLRRIFLKVYPDNARAIRCYEKCGFREYDRTDEDVFMEITGEDGEKGESA